MINVKATYTNVTRQLANRFRNPDYEARKVAVLLDEIAKKGAEISALIDITEAVLETATGVEDKVFQVKLLSLKRQIGSIKDNAKETMAIASKFDRAPERPRSKFKV